jgi:hypothetical protein
MLTLETTEERSALRIVLDHVFEAQEFKQFLWNELQKKLSAYTSEKNNFPTQLMEVVEGLWKEGLYALLLERLEVRRPNVEVRDFLAKYRRDLVAPAAESRTPAHAYQSFVMAGGRVFLGRRDFRMRLQSFGGEGQMRVLAIQGETKTGKTYSKDFLRFLHSFCKDKRPKIISLDVDTPVEKPADLITWIADEFGVANLPPKGPEQATRWIRTRVIPAIKQAVVADKGVSEWWLVLDGFRSDRYPEEIEMFISELQTALDYEMPEIRLLLINYRNVDTTYVPIDRTTGISLDDIMEFFRFANQQEGSPHSEKKLQEEARRAMQEAADENSGPEKKDEYLGQLSRKVTVAARRLFPKWMKV